MYVCKFKNTNTVSKLQVTFWHQWLLGTSGCFSPFASWPKRLFSTGDWLEPLATWHQLLHGTSCWLAPMLIWHQWLLCTSGVFSLAEAKSHCNFSHRPDLFSISNSEYLVRNPVQAALRSNKRQKAKKFFFKYFWLGMTLRPEGSRNLF